MSIGSPMQPLLQLSPEMLQHLRLGGFQQAPAHIQIGTDHTPLSLLHLFLTLMCGVATHTPALSQSIEMIDVSCRTIATEYEQHPDWRFFKATCYHLRANRGRFRFRVEISLCAVSTPVDFVVLIQHCERASQPITPRENCGSGSTSISGF